MSGSSGGGDNYTGGPDDWNIDPTTAAWQASNTGMPTWDGSGNWDMGQSWWDKNTPSPATMAQITAMRGALTSLKPLSDPNGQQVAARFPAVPAVPGASIHQGQPTDALSSYLQTLQQREQAYRSQFMPKVTGLLGG
jgi:hypothetical protein